MLLRVLPRVEVILNLFLQLLLFQYVMPENFDVRYLPKFVAYAVEYLQCFCLRVIERFGGHFPFVEVASSAQRSIVSDSQFPQGLLNEPLLVDFGEEAGRFEYVPDCIATEEYLYACDST